MGPRELTKIYTVAEVGEYLPLIEQIDLIDSLPLTIGLIGQMGAGKTTLTKVIMTACGLDSAHVLSPTYNLQNIYLGKDFQVEHWDLYRLQVCPDELLEPAANQTLRIVEWVDLIPNYQELIDYQITLSIIDSSKRQIEIQKLKH